MVACVLDKVVAVDRWDDEDETAERRLARTVSDLEMAFAEHDARGYIAVVLP